MVLEGDTNRVELRSASDSVRDAGRGNRVTVPGGDAFHPQVMGPLAILSLCVAPPVVVLPPEQAGARGGNWNDS